MSQLFDYLCHPIYFEIEQGREKERAKKERKMKSILKASIFDIKDVLQVGLDEHNKYRKIHNSPKLTLSSQQKCDAQSTAERNASQGKLVHTEDSELNGQGENLGKFCPTDETPKEIISKVTERW